MKEAKQRGRTQKAPSPRRRCAALQERVKEAVGRGADGRSAGDEDVCCTLGVSQARQERVVWQAGERSEETVAAGAARSWRLGGSLRGAAVR